MTSLVTFACVLLSVPSPAQSPRTRMIPIGPAWSRTSVNTIIFRHCALTTFGNVQYTAYYDADAHVVLAKRLLNTSTWDIRRTDLTGDPADAHKTIVIAADSTGILHIMWNHHVSALHYVRTRSPGSLQTTDRLPTDGVLESCLTYPQFSPLPDGSLLLSYLRRTAGDRDAILKRFDAFANQWTTVQRNLLDGRPGRSAYPEFCVDSKGVLHLAWNWRRNGDVATNHDLNYAKSADAGESWTNAIGQPVSSPITPANGECIQHIPDNSDLINQTSIAADNAGHPYIATYYKPAGQQAAQLMLLHHNGSRWTTYQIGSRQTPLNLAGRGTKRLLLSRPLVLVDSRRATPRVLVVFRDVDRGDRISLASTDKLLDGNWTITDLTTESYGAWEPACDESLWARSNRLHLFVQKTHQNDGDDGPNPADTSPPTMASVLEVDD